MEADGTDWVRRREDGRDEWTLSHDFSAGGVFPLEVAGHRGVGADEPDNFERLTAAGPEDLLRGLH